MNMFRNFSSSSSSVDLYSEIIFKTLGIGYIALEVSLRPWGLDSFMRTFFVIVQNFFHVFQTKDHSSRIFSKYRESTFIIPEPFRISSIWDNYIQDYKNLFLQTEDHFSKLFQNIPTYARVSQIAPHFRNSRRNWVGLGRSRRDWARIRSTQINLKNNVDLYPKITFIFLLF